MLVSFCRRLHSALCAMASPLCFCVSGRQCQGSGHLTGLLAMTYMMCGDVVTCRLQQPNC